MNEIKYQVIVSSNLNKILMLIPIFVKNKKIIRHFVNSNEFWHVEIENGTHVICTSLKKLKNMNIQITDIWIDRDISQEVINKEIMKKYIGRNENIVWI